MPRLPSRKLCEAGYNRDPERLKKLVVFVHFSDLPSRSVLVDGAACNRLSASLETAAAQLKAALQSDWFRYLGLPAVDAHVQRLRDLQAEKSHQRTRSEIESLEPPIELMGILLPANALLSRKPPVVTATVATERARGLYGHMRFAADYFRKIGEHTEPSKAGKHTKPLFRADLNWYCVDELLRDVRETTGKAHFKEIAVLLSGGASGEGKYSTEALKQRAARRLSRPSQVSFEMGEPSNHADKNRTA